MAASDGYRKALSGHGRNTMDLVKVSMRDKSSLTRPFPAPVLMSGRAFIDWYMTEHASPRIHALSSENPFIAAPGILAGTAAPSSGRLSIGGKSPLTGGIKEANMGGTVAHKLGRLGIQGLVVEGMADEWNVLRLSRDGALFEPAGEIVGLDNYEACDKLRGRYGDSIAILIIGVAGERLFTNSTVAGTDTLGRPCRHAARGGVGAIMGAKHLKAVVIDDTGSRLRIPFDQEAFRTAAKDVVEALQSGPYGELLSKNGTPFFVDFDNNRGALQTKNYRFGSFDGVRGINAARLLELNAARGGSTGHACLPGCVVRCSNIFLGPDGDYVTSGIEFETLTLLGSNLGIGDLDVVARMDRKCDGIGIDTIETGSAIGLLNEAGLFEFGDAARAEALIEEIADGTPLGRILGSGAETTARVFGIKRVPTVKGQAIPAHAARSTKGWGVTYATSPQGADHTAGPMIEEPLSPIGQVERSRNSQIVNTALDATGLCHFTFLNKNPELILPLINALHGVQYSVEDFIELGKEMLRRERRFNLEAGIGPEADRLPDWMRKEPLSPTNQVFDVSQDEIDQMFNF
jgi:aldehyde:ferredoxin oxidoreductase